VLIETKQANKSVHKYRRTETVRKSQSEVSSSRREEASRDESKPDYPSAGQKGYPVAWLHSKAPELELEAPISKTNEWTL